MGWTVEPEVPETLLHYSEDPSITLFTPHVPSTNPTTRPAVWTIDPPRAPLYWFPRHCPRVTIWANTSQQLEQLQTLMQTTAWRVQVAPIEWAERIRCCGLYEYRFDPSAFEPWPEAEGQWIATTPQTPISVVAVGDLMGRQASAGVELRLVDDLASIRKVVLDSNLPFSIVRHQSDRRPA